MKGIKILNNGFISVFSAAATLNIFLDGKTYSEKEHQREILIVQGLMQLNYKIYGVHILETNSSLYKQIRQANSFSDPKQPPIIEEIEITDDLNIKKMEFFKDLLFSKNDKKNITVEKVGLEDLPDELLDIFKNIIDAKMAARKKAEGMDNVKSS